MANATGVFVLRRVRMDDHQPDSAENHAEQWQSASRELAAFVAAVTKLYGAERASLSAEDWLSAAQQMELSPWSSSANWRAVTIAASARLASRLYPAVGQRRTQTAGNP